MLTKGYGGVQGQRIKANRNLDFSLLLLRPTSEHIEPVKLTITRTVWLLVGPRITDQGTFTGYL